MRARKSLTYDIRLVLAGVVISSANLHLHKGTDDAASDLGQVACSEHLERPGTQVKLRFIPVLGDFLVFGQELPATGR